MGPSYKKENKRKHIILVIIIAILVIALAAYFATSYLQTGANYISGKTELNMHVGQILLYKLPYVNGIFAMYLKNSTNNSALIYITKLPILVYPVISLDLGIGGSANISSSQTGVSDVHIYLISSNTEGASVEITPIDTSLGIKESGNIVILEPASFQEKMLYNGPSVPIVSTTSTTTSTSITTTSINQSSIIPLAQIMSFINTTTPGILMNNFNMLYYKDRACNASVYNATFQTLEGMKAVGPLSFYNVSPSVPRSIEINVSKISNNLYLVTYIGITPSKIYTGPLMEAKIAISPSPLIENITFDGPFKYMNLTNVESIYRFQSSINNFCGAYMPYIPK
jgi:hypothetical protein